MLITKGRKGSLAMRAELETRRHCVNHSEWEGRQISCVGGSITRLIEKRGICRTWEIKVLCN